MCCAEQNLQNHAAICAMPYCRPEAFLEGDCASQRSRTANMLGRFTGSVSHQEGMQSKVNRVTLFTFELADDVDPNVLANSEPGPEIVKITGHYVYGGAKPGSLREDSVC